VASSLAHSMANGTSTSSGTRIGFIGILQLVVLVWGLEIVDQVLLGGRTDGWGVVPRSLSGLIGIPLMPFLHGGWAHLIANTGPFIVLGWIVQKAEGRRFASTAWTIILLSGLGIWAFAREASHIGASGLIYGLFGYVIARSWNEKKINWFVIGVLVAFAYGGMIFGVLPSAGERISWEGHLAGLIVGMFVGKASVGHKG